MDSVHELTPPQAIGEVFAALTRLRAIGAEVALLGAAAVELTRCGFDRVVLTRVTGSVGRVALVHDVAGHEQGLALLAALRARPLPLQEFPVEAEMLRRREPVLVAEVGEDSARLRQLVATSGVSSYVAAPLAPEGKVIALLHADCHGRTVDEHDRERLWLFTEGLGYVYERRALIERLRTVRQEVRRANTSIMAVMHESCHAPIELVAAGDADDDDVAWSAASVFVTTELPAGARLTRREREVMELIAAGRTNSQIAGELVLSEQTVRSHVKRILRKLRVRGRAEAVARWTSLTPRERG